MNTATKRLLVWAWLILPLAGCRQDPDLKKVDFRQKMRNLVGQMSRYARERQPGFIIVPQNGVALTTLNGQPEGPAATLYLNDIDGVGQEELFYGYEADNRATPADVTGRLSGFLIPLRQQGKAVLVTDYCSDASKMDDAYLKNQRLGFISFAAPDRELRQIPPYPPAPRNTNSRDILRLTDAANFLYLINPEGYAGRQAFLDSLAATSFDVVILDAFYADSIWSPAELATLRTKAGGGQRLLLAYMSIGEAEDYRHYWQAEWNTTPPSWLSAPNPDWPGNYKVKYWDPEWQAILYGHSNAYLDRLLAAGFDGAYLDLIDAYEYFEDL